MTVNPHLMDEDFLLAWRVFQHSRLWSVRINWLRLSRDDTGSPVATHLDPALIERSHLNTRGPRCLEKKCKMSHLFPHKAI